MGVEEVSQVFHSISNFVAGSKSGLSATLAWIGIALVAIVVIYYIAVGLSKAIRAFLSMKVKYLGVFTLLAGVVLIAIAIALP